MASENNNVSEFSHRCRCRPIPMPTQRPCEMLGWQRRRRLLCRHLCFCGGVHGRACLSGSAPSFHLLHVLLFSGSLLGHSWTRLVALGFSSIFSGSGARHGLLDKTCCLDSSI